MSSSNSSNNNNNDHDRDCDTAISLIDSAVALLSGGVDDIDNNDDWWNSSQTDLSDISDNINKNNKYDYHFEQDDKDDVESQIEEICEGDDDTDSISLSLASSSSSSSVHSLATFDDEDDIDCLPFETKPTGSGAVAAELSGNILRSPSLRGKSVYLLAVCSTQRQLLGFPLPSIGPHDQRHEYSRLQ